MQQVPEALMCERRCNMKVIVNDLSFQYMIYSQEEALSRCMDFIRICHEMESGRLKNVEKLILVDKINVQYEIAPGCSFMKLLQQVLPREERGYLLSVLLNRESSEEIPEETFVCDGKESRACSVARNEAVISLMSSEIFSKSSIWGKIGSEQVSLKNIGRDEHILEHRQILGKRIYHANSGKHKKERWNSYGKGKTASPMDLDDDEAQRLLDRAVEYKGRLYGMYRGKYYSFQKEQDVYYHGYINNELGDDVKMKLNTYVWE